MFDLTSSKLLLLGIIALLVVGPKDLPALLRTVGRYVGMMRRQAAEFRAQFDEAMKESELADLKQQVEDFGKDAESAVREAEQSFHKEVASVETEANKTLAEVDAAVRSEVDAVNGVIAPEAKPALPEGHEPAPALPSPESSAGEAVPEVAHDPAANAPADVSADLSPERARV